ncbi:MAG: TIGR01906 family membrane protein [Lachnospiraceae bacterium]|nr:TIGR01906 family membrane protein [Lachnospiraceae bacterium]
MDNNLNTDKNVASAISYDNSDSFKPKDILLGVYFFFALLGLGLFIAINFKPIYYTCIDKYELEEASGLSREEIILNYDALIAYCSPFHFGELSFPTLKASVSGLSHFAEAKRLMAAFYIIGVIAAVITVFGFIRRIRNREIRFYRVCAVTSIAVPLILALICIIDFDRLFVVFHKIAFDNDDWLFNPETDPVIRILPEEFFMRCLITILLTIIIGAVTLFVIYMCKKRKKRKEGAPIPKPMNFYY